MNDQNADRELILKGMSQQCIAVRIRLLSRLITNIYDAALSPLGIKLTQLNILIVVYLRRSIGYDELCRRIKLEKSTVSRNIERMKKKRWLDVVQNQEDRKMVLKVTIEGERLIDAAHDAWLSAQERAKGLLGAEGANALCGIANDILRKDKVK